MPSPDRWPQFAKRTTSYGCAVGAVAILGGPSFLPAQILQWRLEFPLVRANSAEKMCLPESQLESLWLSVWRLILRQDHISNTSNFFSIGGDSIKAIQVISNMNKLGYEYSVPDLCTNPTIKQLASLSRLTASEAPKAHEKAAFASVSPDELDKLSALLNR